MTTGIKLKKKQLFEKHQVGQYFNLEKLFVSDIASVKV